MAKDLKLKLVLQCKDDMSKMLRRAVSDSDKDFKKLQESLNKTSEGFDKFGKRAALTGGSLLAISGIQAKTAADFEDQMNNVATLINTDVESLDDMKKKVLEIGKNSPVALSDLTEGLYNIRSAGVSAEDQFKVLEASARLSVAGLGTTNEAVDLVTSSLNAFKLQGKDAEKVYDNIFKVIKYGKTNVSGLAQGFGATAGVIAGANIKLDEYMASVAALTTVGQPAAVAHTQIKAAVSSLTRGSKEQQKVFNQLGAKSFKDLIQKSGGMVNAFNRISKALGGNETKIQNLLGSVEAFNAVKSLTTNVSGAFNATLKDMRYGADLLEEGYEKKLSGFNQKLKVFQNTLKAVGIGLGNNLLGPFTGVLNVAQKVILWFDKMPEGLKSFIVLATAGTGAVLTVLGTVSTFAGAAIKGFSSMLGLYRELDIYMWATTPKIKGFFNGMKNGLTGILPALRNATISSWSLAGALTATGITLAIGAIAAGAFLIYKYWKPIKAFFVGFGQGFREGLEPVLPLFGVIAEAFKPMTDAIKGFFTPINTNGERALNWGKEVGKVFAGVVNWLIQMVNGITEFLQKLGKADKSKINLDGSKDNKNTKTDGSYRSGLDTVPYDGFIAELHKGESVLTKEDANVWRNYNTSSNSSVVVNYSPSITISNGDKTEFKRLLNQHKNEIAKLVEEVDYRKRARAYA